ncbi:MAG: hypothetical protein AAGD86_08705, partial [Pseudomonadota bacterium]
CASMASPSNPWHLRVAHSAQGEVTAGSVAALIDSIRAGCRVRVAWGARRAADPTRTIEHSAVPNWIAVRSGESVSAQIGGFTPNLRVLGDAPDEHPRYARFGGTTTLTEWRADLSTDGSFDAVWFHPHDGSFVERVPQRHPMRWYADCLGVDASPLYPPPDAAR